MSIEVKYNLKFQILNIIFLNLLILFYLIFMSELVQSLNVRRRGFNLKGGDSFDGRFYPDNNFIQSQYFNNKWKFKELKAEGKQDDSGGPVYPILTPGPDGDVQEEAVQTGDNNGSDGVEGTPVIRPSEDYLYDFNFIVDFGGIVMRSITRDLPVGPLVGLSRNIFESEECAEYVSCGTSRFSLRHETFNWLHNFLVDFPFKGDLAERLKSGSSRASDKTISECDFKCNPIGTLTRGISVLETLQSVVKITSKQ